MANKHSNIEKRSQEIGAEIRTNSNLDSASKDMRTGCGACLAIVAIPALIFVTLVYSCIPKDPGQSKAKHDEIMTRLAEETKARKISNEKHYAELAIRIKEQEEQKLEWARKREEKNKIIEHIVLREKLSNEFIVDMSATRLDPEMQGYDIKRLFKKLMYETPSRDKSNDEFLTADEIKQKEKEHLGDKLPEHLIFCSPRKVAGRIFEEKEEVQTFHNLKYNILTKSFEGHANTGKIQSEMTNAGWQSRSVKSRWLPSQTECYGLIEKDRYDSSQYLIGLSFPCELEIAKKIREPRIAIIAKPKGDLYSFSNDYSKKRSGREHRRDLVVEIKEIWFCHPTSGDILYRQKH